MRNNKISGIVRKIIEVERSDKSSDFVISVEERPYLGEIDNHVNYLSDDILDVFDVGRSAYEKR